MCPSRRHSTAWQDATSRSRSDEGRLQGNMKFAKIVMLGACSIVVAVGAILFTAGVGMQLPAPHAEVTNRKPFADYIGRDYRIVGDVSALAWNDFPDKDRSSRFP